MANQAPLSFIYSINSSNLEIIWARPIVCGWVVILQSSRNSSITAQEYAGFSTRAASRRDRVRTDLGWLASSVLTGLSFRDAQVIYVLSFRQALVLGILQGVSELFPISSLGHSIILPALLGWSIDQNANNFLTFLVATHFATAAVLFFLYFNDWVRIIRGALRSVWRRSLAEDSDAKLAWLLAVGAVPAGGFGFGFQKQLQLPSVICGEGACQTSGDSAARRTCGRPYPFTAPWPG